jgi:hypothetical protein
LAHFGHALFNDLAIHPPQFKPKGNVPRHAQMREEHVILIDEANAALLRRQAGDILAVQQNTSLAKLVQARDGFQQHRLASAGRPEDDEILACSDVEVNFTQMKLSEIHP